MSWIALSLLCAFSLASADAATKAWLQGFSAVELLVVRFCVPGLLMMPLLTGLPPLAEIPAVFWLWIAVLTPLELAAMLLYMAAIRDYPLSLTVPYLAFSPVFVVGIAWVLLGEEISARGGAGIALVVVGAWLLNSGHARRRDWRGWIAPLTAIFHERGSRMMLGVAAIYGVTATLGKGAMQYVPAESFGAFYFGLLGLAVLALVALPRPRILGKLLTRPWAVLAVGGLVAVMVYTHFLAIQQVEVAYMVAVKRTSLLFGILYGAVIFGETGMAARIPAGLIMLSGVTLILT